MEGLGFGFLRVSDFWISENTKNHKKVLRTEGSDTKGLGCEGFWFRREDLIVPNEVTTEEWNDDTSTNEVSYRDI